MEHYCYMIEAVAAHNLYLGRILAVGVGIVAVACVRTAVDYL